jgi:hypothetical protein
MTAEARHEGTKEQVVVAQNPGRCEGGIARREIQSKHSRKEKRKTGKKEKII